MRIRFIKKGPARFISHLDLVRTMTRAMTRAKIPVKITQGFNPHPYLVFSVPLPLGIASDCELVDIGLSEAMSAEELKKALGAEMPAGLDITDVYEPTSSLNDIVYADYRLTVPAVLCDKFDAYMMQDTIEVSKHSKKGPDKVLDLKPDIRLSPESEDEEGKTVILRLPCGNTKNIGINLLLDSFYVFAEQDARLIRAERICFADANDVLFR